MKLEKQAGFTTGIKCDLCGSEHEGDFTYYSFDIHEVNVVKNRNPVGISNLPIIFSLDVCPACVAGASESIKLHYAPTKIGVNCDLCGTQMRGDFTFYYVDVSAVIVSMSNSQIKCGACDRRMAPGKPCQCGKDQPVKIASVSVNEKFLQLVLCPGHYNQMSDSAAAVRLTVSGQPASQ